MTSPYALIGEKLCDAGYSSIPVRPGTKLPGSMTFGEWYGEMNWQRFADRAPTPMETPLWNKWTDAGVCVVMGYGGLVSIDIDTEDAEITAAILSVLPESPVAKRGAKGKTLFYRGNVLKVNKETGEITGYIPSRGYNVGAERVLDLLAYGKQTILPPSIHPSGRAYQWITEDTLVDTPIDALPMLPDNVAELLADVLAPFGYTAPEPHTMVSVGDSDSMWREIKDLAFANLDAWVPHLGLPKTKKMNRDNWRAIPAWRGADKANLSFTSKGIKDFYTDEKHSPIDVVMLAHGSDFETATRWLQEILGYKPKVDDFDCSAFAERQMARTYVAPPAESIPIEAAAATPVRAPRGTIDPFDANEAGGILGAIAKFTADTAHRPSREFAMLAAIGFMSALCNRRYVTPSGFGTNLYAIGLSPPSFGKEHPQNVVKTLAFDSGMQFLLGAGEVSSGSAIEKVVRRAPNSVMVWDELGIVLQSINGNKAPGHADSIRKVLLDIYSKSRHGSMWYGKETADPKKDNSPIHSPCLSLLGFSTTTEFYKGLPESALRDGFLARLLIIQASERGARQKTKPLLIPPPSLIDAIKAAAADFPKKGNLSGASFRDSAQKPSFYEVPWVSPDAEEAWIQIDDWQLSEINEDSGKFGILGRAAEHTQKLATLRAVSRLPCDPRVTADDVAWGYSFVQRSLDNVDRGVTEYMADSQHEQLCKSILEALGTAKNGMAVSSMIRRKGISKYDERARNSALKDLVISGQVVQSGKTYKLPPQEPLQEAA